MKRSLRVRRNVLVLSVGLLAFAAEAAAFHGHGHPTPRFWGLGDLPGGETISYAYDLSRRGDVISGESFSAISQVHGEGVLWQRVSPSSWHMTGIGLPTADSLNSPASGVSDDDHWIVGRVSFGPPSSPDIDTDAYRWRPGLGFERLGLPPGFVLVAALGADVNANKIVGYGGPNPNYQDIRALLWRHTPSGFAVHVLEPQYTSQANRIESDGRAAVGWGNSPAAQAAEGAAGREAAFWRLGPGGVLERRWLGALSTGPFHSQALGLARRGPRLLVVGDSGDFPDTDAPVLWTLEGHGGESLQALTILPGFTGGGANAISEKGDRIVGSAWRTVGRDLEFACCVWDRDPQTGSYTVANVKDVLTSLGVGEVEGWTLVATTGVSGDGTVLCGYGTDPGGFDEGWAAELP